MRVDAYTRIVLTVIAACLVWIAASGRSVVPALEAQDRTATRVVIVGWEPGGAAGSRTLPLPIEVAGWTDRMGGRHEFPQPFPIERARQQGAGLPTGPDR